MRRRHALWWLLAAATFVIGLFAGGIIVGVVSGGAAAPAVRAVTVTATPTAAAPSASGGGAVSGQAVLSPECLRAINSAQSAYRSVAGLAGAVRSFDVARIDQIIQQLEPLQRQLRSALAACRVSTTVSGALPTGSSTPSPGPS